MAIHTVRTFARASMFGALLLAGGCDGAILIGPENQLEVTNAADQFQFQLTALENVTDTRSYQWENSGARATIDVSQAITSGSAMLTIRDADGIVLYEADLAAGSNATTPDGLPGTWSIDVVLAGVTGTFNFRVQKAT